MDDAAHNLVVLILYKLCLATTNFCRCTKDSVNNECHIFIPLSTMWVSTFDVGHILYYESLTYSLLLNLVSRLKKGTPQKNLYKF